MVTLKIKYFCLSLLLVAAGAGCNSQIKVVTNKGSPEWIVGSFFVEKEFPNREYYYTGEMKEYYIDTPNIRSSQPDGVKCAYHLVYQDDNTRNYSIQYSYQDWCGNWYCFVIKENGTWKLEAVRSLSTIGVIYTAIEEIEGKPQKTVEEQWDLQNAKLVLKCDQQLKEYFYNHKENFKAIIDIFKNNSCLDRLDSKGKVSKRDKCEKQSFEDATAKVRELYINYVSRSENGILMFCVGGVTDNTVGFLFVPESSKPPVMSSDEYILIEKIDNEWYLYKTT